MRVCVASPDPGILTHDKFAWIAYGAMDAGHEVVRAHDVRGVAAADASCDVVLFSQYSGGMNPWSLVEISGDRKARWCSWWWDLVPVYRDVPLAGQPVMQTFAPFLRVLDVAFFKERGLLEEYRDAGIEARWMWQGCPDHIKPSRLRRFRWDVLVVGRGSHEQRWRDADAMCRQGLKVAWVGFGNSGKPPAVAEMIPWCAPEYLPTLVSEAKVCLSVDARQDVDGYTSDRLYLLLGAGGIVFHRKCCWQTGPEWYDPSHAWLYEDSSLPRMVDEIKYGERLWTERLLRGFDNSEWAHRWNYSRAVSEIIETVMKPKEDVPCRP